MRNLLLYFSISFISLVSSAQDCDLQFNGAYVCIPENSSQGFNEFIRFYDNGEVITSVSVYELEQSISWFHSEDPGVSQGSYEQVGCDISFSTRHDDSKFYYEGTIEGDFLKLKVLYPGKKKKEMVELMFEFQKTKLK